MKKALKVFVAVTTPVWIFPALMVVLFRDIATDVYEDASEIVDRWWPGRADD